MSEWLLGQTTWKDHNNLGKAIAKFVLSNPQWLLYLRKDTRFPCTNCFDLATNSVITHECPICYGQGYKTTLQLVPGRITSQSAALPLSEGSVELQPGTVVLDMEFADFPRFVFPALEDIICEVSWPVASWLIPSTPDIKPIGIIAVYQIKYIRQMFEREIVYFNTSIKRLDANIQSMRDLLPNMRNFTVVKDDLSWQELSFWQ